MGARKKDSDPDTMFQLPEAFRAKMEKLLGEEYEVFEKSYDRPRRRGLRVNRYKVGSADWEELAEFRLESIPWVENGFFFPDTERPARHPLYAAGLYYLQEPSAMIPASRLPLEQGDRVLDLCAAPGGKATELASRLAVLDRQKKRRRGGPETDDTEKMDRDSGKVTMGSLIANDISSQRAKALLHNLEMNGTDNYCVLNETPERLAEVFPEYFDKIMLDAPCSGEGMFRKEEAALRLWSPERVADFTGQQKKILACAFRMLAPGGMLMYSTCTFSPEENEQQIAEFLLVHPEMQMMGVEPYEGFAPGRPDWVTKLQTGAGDLAGSDGMLSEIEKKDLADQISRCVRIWPHRMDGEGHFLALMKKSSEKEKGLCRVPGMAEPEVEGSGPERYPDGTDKDLRKKKKMKGRRSALQPGRIHREQTPDKEQIRLLRNFLCDIVGDTAADEIIKKVGARQERAFLPGPAGDRLQGLHVIRGGQYIGEWKKNRFEPSQSLAMCLRGEAGEESKQEALWSVREGTMLSLSLDDLRLKQYLRGESFETEGLPDGWILVVRGAAKNHYPASWRMTAG